MQMPEQKTKRAVHKTARFFVRINVEQFWPDCTVYAGRLTRGTALRLLAMACHVASPRLVPHAIRLGIAWQVRPKLL
jgi:hypothetical protein